MKKIFACKNEKLKIKKIMEDEMMINTSIPEEEIQDLQDLLDMGEITLAEFDKVSWWLS